VGAQQRELLHFSSFLMLSLDQIQGSGQYRLECVCCSPAVKKKKKDNEEENYMEFSCVFCPS